MDPSYELLVRYTKTVAPFHVARALVAQWRTSGRPRLFSFPRSGDGVEPTENFLESSLNFVEGRQYAAVRLRTERGRKGADVADLYFTNPTWQFQKPANYVSVTFNHLKIDESRPGYTAKALGELLGALASAGPAELGYVEAYSVLQEPRMEFLARLGEQSASDGPLHWVSLLRPESCALVLGPTGREPLLLLEKLSSGGAIVATSEGPPLDRRKHLEALVGLAEQLRFPGGTIPSDVPCRSQPGR